MLRWSSGGERDMSSSNGGEGADWRDIDGFAADAALPLPVGCRYAGNK
jgi:hypothetical protein